MRTRVFLIVDTLLTLSVSQLLRRADIERRGIARTGNRLRPPADATTVTVRDGKTIFTDAPFTESKESIAGFDLIDVDNLDVALEIAAAHPIARFGRVEVRPIRPFE